MSNASDKLEEIYAKKVYSDQFSYKFIECQEILNEDFIPNMIEKIVYYDIELRLKSFYAALKKTTQIVDGNINKIKKESELEAKIKDILSTFKRTPDINSRVQELSSYEKTMGFSKLDDLQNSNIFNYQNVVN